MCKKLNKESAILKEAEKLFIKYGYKKVSIDEIAGAAGIAKGTFYLYFKNKDDLYNRIFENYYNKAMEEATRSCAAEKKEMHEKLYENFFCGLYFFSKKKILKEIFLQNRNYFSETVNFEKLVEFNARFAKILFGKDLKKIRADMEIGNIIRIYIFLLGVIHNQREGGKDFWKLAENTAKIFIDGVLSNRKWKVKKRRALFQ